MSSFDPNGVGTEDSGIFGLPYSYEESSTIVIPVPWEATTCDGAGCSESPSKIFDESKLVELYDSELKNFYEEGIFMIPIDSQLLKKNEQAKNEAGKIIENGGVIGNDSDLSNAKKITDKLCSEMNQFVYNNTLKVIKDKKTACILGGDHSVSLGSIKAHAELYNDLGVLQIDAHCDLRKEFESLSYSHGSVMYNALEQTELKHLTQVGIRGYCEEEFEYIQGHKNIISFFDEKIHSELFSGTSWDNLCKNISNSTPENIYLSIDIDGLDVQYCPNTGTPMPGGLSYNMLIRLLQILKIQKKKIVGFDLCEVNGSADSIDIKVAANLLYKTIGLIT